MSEAWLALPFAGTVSKVDGYAGAAAHARFRSLQRDYGYFGKNLA
jgi:hypothetical protein